MIYNDGDFSKRSIEASILSIKNDINRKVAQVQSRYTEIYDAIVAESNRLVEFLNEFRAAVDAIVTECNDLQGLTDEELTEIKQRIEELKQILDSIEIPDLPKIKKPDEIFIPPSSDSTDNSEGQCESGFCAIGVGEHVSGSSSLPGKEDGNKPATFGCYEYTVMYGEEGLCNKNYIVWGNCDGEDGICVMNYDKELDDHCGQDYTGQIDGCLSNYEDDDFKCDSSFIIDMCVNEDSGNSCGSGYMSSNVNCDYMYGEDTDYAQCQSNFATCEENVGDAPTTTCEEGYFHDGVVATVCNGYAAHDQNCPQSYLNNYGLIDCAANFKEGNNECKSNFEKTGDSSVSACNGGFKDDTHNCPTNWSYGLGKNACNADYSDGNVQCTKDYITDGEHKWCRYPDGACGPCQSGYCSPANYTQCSYCPGYTPSCGEDEPCSEGEPPCAWPPPCDDEPCGESEPCYQEPTCQPCVTLTDTCGGPYGCSDSCYPVCVLGHDDCEGVCNVIRHGSND